MSSLVRLTAVLAALLACALAPVAVYANDELVAQLAQATPEPTPGDEPTLSDDPPDDLGDATPTPTPTATAAPDDDEQAEELASTGSDTVTLALAGLSLLGMGLALRFRLQLADGRR